MRSETTSETLVNEHNEPCSAGKTRPKRHCGLVHNRVRVQCIHSPVKAVSPFARSNGLFEAGSQCTSIGQPQLSVNKDARKFYLRTNITAAMCTKPSTIELCAVFLMHLGKRREFSCLPLYSTSSKRTSQHLVFGVPGTDLVYRIILPRSLRPSSCKYVYSFS